MAIVGLIRDGKRRYGTARTTRLAAQDALVIEATPEALDEFRAALKLDVADETRAERLRAEGDGLSKIEVVVTDQSRIAGKTAQAIGLNWRRRAVLLGISRGGKPFTSAVRKTPAHPGDILLLLVPQGSEAEVTEWLGCLPLADRGLTVTQNNKVWLAIGLFAAAVAAASLGLVYLPVALGIVVVGYVLTGILPLTEIYDHIEWPVVVLLGSMIPLGAALETSGGTELIASALVNVTQGLPAWAVLTIIMVVTMTLSDVLNNTATAIVAAPDRDRDGRQARRQPRPVPDGRRRRRLLRLPHPDRAQEQHPDPRPRRLPVRRLLAHGPAAGDAGGGGVDPADPGVLAACERGRRSADAGDAVSKSRANAFRKGVPPALNPRRTGRARVWSASQSRAGLAPAPPSSSRA